MRRQIKANRLWILLMCLATVSLAAVVAAAAEPEAKHEVHGSNEFSVTSNKVAGPGRSQSSLTEGTHYLEIFNLYGNGRAGKFNYSWNVGAKATDDRRNDRQDVSITNLQARLSNKTHSFTMGDTFEAFSQYALNTAVKGGSYRLTPERKYLPQISLLYGYAYSRWDDFWEGNAVERRVFGGKVRQNINSYFSLGFSGVYSDDENRIRGGESISHQTLTVDWDYRPLPGLTIQGESSYIDGERSRDEDAPFYSFDGVAYKITATGDGGPSRVILEYEYVTPEFMTTIGSATPDREKLKAKWRYKYSKNLTLTASMLWFHDNLNKQKGYRTDHYKPEISASLKKPFQRQYATLDLSYKLDRTQSDAVRGLDHFITLGYRDRFGMFDNDNTFGVIVYDQKNLADAAVTRKELEYTYNTRFSSRHTKGRFILKPSVYLGGWTRNDEMAENIDQIVEYAGGMGIEIPGLKITSNFRAGENRLLKDLGPDTARTFASMDIFWRPKALAMVQGEIFLKAGLNDFRYDPNRDNGSRNFRETSVTLGTRAYF